MTPSHVSFRYRCVKQPRGSKSQAVRDLLHGTTLRSFISRFDSDEKLVPFDMSAGASGSPSRKALSQHGKVSNLIHLHQQPVGEWARAGSGNLVRQQLDRAVEYSVIVRLNDALSVVVDKPNHAPVFD